MQDNYGIVAEITLQIYGFSEREIVRMMFRKVHSCIVRIVFRTAVRIRVRICGSNCVERKEIFRVSLKEAKEIMEKLNDVIG